MTKKKLTKAQNKRFDEKIRKWVKEHGLVNTNAPSLSAWRIGIADAELVCKQFLAEELQQVRQDTREGILKLADGITDKKGMSVRQEILKLEKLLKEIDEKT